MRTIYELQDKGTMARRSMITIGSATSGSKHWTGYVCFIVNRKMYERVVYQKEINYIIFRKEVIAIDPHALKPISGAWNKESLNVSA